MLASPAPLAADVFPADETLHTLLAICLTGAILYTPVYDDAGQVLDFAFAYVNPVAQRQLGLPAQPATTLGQQFPQSLASGTFAFLHDTFLSGQPGHFEPALPADALYFRVAAQRVGGGLLVNFTSFPDLSSKATDRVLRESQLREQAARAEAEHQRKRFEQLFQQAPAAISILSGPELVQEFVNPAYQQLFPDRQLVGRPLLASMPELVGTAVWEKLQRVYTTGQPDADKEYHLPFARPEDGTLENRYFDFVLQPLTTSSGRTEGIISLGVEVTAQVQAHQQMRQLNEELETRVLARTQEAHAAQAEAERQRQILHEVLMQLPAQVAIFHGSQHEYTFVNTCYQGFFPSRELIGRSVAEAVPEAVEQGFAALLDRVYCTGEAEYGQEQEVKLYSPEASQPTLAYFNSAFLALRNAQNQVEGILNFSYDVTALVEARQQVQRLNEELETRVLARTQEARAARAEAERQRGRLEQLFMRVPAAICIFGGPTWVYEFVNPSYQQLFPGRQLLGLPLLEALPEIASQPLMDILRGVYDTGISYEGQEVLVPLARTTDGPIENIYFDLAYMARFDEAGQVDGFITYAHDVTERVAARRQREAQAQALARILEQAPVAIAIFRGPQLIIELANGKHLELWGRTAEQVVGRPLFEAIPEAAGAGYEELLAGVMQTGEPLMAHELTARLERYGQREQVYFDFVYQPLREPDGQITGVVVVATDITEQVRARQQVEQNEQKLKLLTDALPVLIGYLNQEQRYAFANRAYEKWFGRNPADVLGRHVREVVGEEAYACAQPYIERALAGERLDYELAMPYRAGFTRYIRVSYLPDVHGGQVAGIHTLVVDITEQLEARRIAEASERQAQQLAAELALSNQQLSTTNQQLTRTNVDLDNFIYTASHDLKAPIANIEGLLLALEQELPVPARTGHVLAMLEMMQGAVERFKRTINNLTDISRLQKEHEQPTSQVLLRSVLEEVQLDLLPLMQETGARLEVDVPANATLLFAEKNLRSVVYNLLSNALKYRHPDRPPHVHIRYEEQESYQVLAVQDNGLGLDTAHEQDKLFAMFQRLHSHVEGSGVGLYMVKRIVENAGGYIAVQSALGQGSTFTVYFPRTCPRLD